MEQTKLYINGQFVGASDRRTFESRNPYDDSLTGLVARAGSADIDLAVQAAHRAFHEGPWQSHSPKQRAELLRNVAEGMGRNIRRLVQCEIADSGATRKKATDDVLSTLAFFKQFADLTESFNFDEEIIAPNSDENSQRILRHAPVGVCAAIIPWNFPLKMAAWKIAPALAAGNTLVLKPSELSPMSAMILAEIIDELEIPDGVINILPGFGEDAGEALVGHPLVDKIAFTGSTAVGRTIMARAAETLKRVTLECGGKSANIILADADMDLAIDGAVNAMYYHNGQCCEAGTRLLLPASQHDEIVKALINKISMLTVGAPSEKTTDVGPLISEKQQQRVLDYIALGEQEGAQLACGGHQEFNQGCFVQPTVFTNVHPNMRIAQEEIFGPVLCVLRYENEQHAIEIANNSSYGLAAGIWSKDLNRANQIATKLRSGTVWINNYHVFDAYTPFGGFKQSGIGREFGKAGLHEYTEPQCIYSK